jgi:alpha-L-arabinofuranosidase
LLDEKASIIDAISGLRHYAQAGYDEKTGEIVLKIVNATPDVFSPKLEIKNTKKISRVGEMISISSADATFENTFENPHKIDPIKKVLKNLSTEFKLQTAPWSFSIIRIKGN